MTSLESLKMWDWWYLIIMVGIGILIGVSLKMGYLNQMNENQCNAFLCDYVGVDHPACGAYDLVIIEPEDYDEEYIKSMYDLTDYFDNESVT